VSLAISIDIVEADGFCASSQLRATCPNQLITRELDQMASSMV